MAGVCVSFRVVLGFCFLAVTLMLVSCFGAGGDCVWAAESGDDPDIRYLKQLTIENLLSTEVTSVSKKIETVANTAAAVFVITHEDIRRSGSRTIPDLLRMVPGVNVASINANSWAISSQGFNGRFSNKLLVMIDGRTVYSPSFSGTYWDVQDTLLEDIDRIEIIRGPGATIWGANAVNGVINIITRSSDQTQGLFASAAAGNRVRGEGNLRYGGNLTDKGSYRLFAKYSGHDDFVNGNGTKAADAWDVVRGGFRADWEPSGHDVLTFQGDIYSGESGQTMSLPGTTPTVFPSRINLSGGNLLTRWERQLHDGGGLSLQAYYDHTRRFDAYMKESRDTIDVDFNHRMRLLGNHELVWGGGYRWTTDATQPGVTTAFISPKRQDNLYSMFIQDDIALFDKRFHVILGSKFEHNGYSGFEVQPTARLLWTPDPHQSAWLAVSRAVRTPSRTDHDITATLYDFPGTSTQPHTRVTLNGSSTFKSEELLAYEIGYRTQPVDWLSCDLTAFYNDYKRLRSAVAGQLSTVIDSGGVTTTLPLRIGNDLEGDAFGVELFGSIKMAEWWRVFLGYSWLRMNLKDMPKLLPVPTQEYNEGPQHQFSVRWHMDLPHHVEFDPALYYVSRISQRRVPAYVRLDLRLGWRPLEWVEVSVKAENLLEENHAEFGDDLGLQASRVPRSFFGEVRFFY
ncbi:MAG: TonB-dependent receptor [Desulfuromonadales bacterium]|nr:TonB-dependent receptor [Desulfuromonadales bacterium]